MVNLSIEQIRSLMDKQECIRNISIIGNINHGKTTMTNNLVLSGGINVEVQPINQDKQIEKQVRNNSIESTEMLLHYKYNSINSDNNKIHEQYLINLINSSNHPDLSAESITTFRIIDGAIIIVDSVEGISKQTETMIRYAMKERIKFILMVNKVDKSIIDLKLDSEALYNSFLNIINKTNIVISTFKFKNMQNFELDPSFGNVSFGSAKDQWAFSLRIFARIYHKKFGIEEERMMKKLWGDNYYDKDAKKWRIVAQDENKKPLTRAFVQFIMDPIYKISQTIMSGKKQEYLPILEKLKLDLTEDEKKLIQRELLKSVLSKWLSFTDNIFEMIVRQLPSPKQAQIYRTQYLYEGPMSDSCAIAMKNCDPKGPLMISISKMIKSETQKGRFYAFGRVFSGTVTSKQKVRIMSANYGKQAKKGDIFQINILNTNLLVGKTVQIISDVPCGNIVALSGIQDYMSKSGTITSIDHPIPSPIISLKYSVSPIVKAVVIPKNPTDLLKMIEGIKKLSKSDPLAACIVEETGQNVIACCNQLHLQLCINDLQKEYAQCEIVRSDPFVTYKETITQSSRNVMVKSQNKHNRLYGNCEPLDEKLVDEIQSGQISMTQDTKQRSMILVEQFGWLKSDTFKLWCFGPENSGPNVLLDATVGIQYMCQVRDSMVSSFQWATKQGVICEENMRGIRFNIIDTQLRCDSIHRGGGQIIPASRKLYYASQLLGKPGLFQPIFLYEITCPTYLLGEVYQILNRRRGEVIEENDIAETPLSIVKAYVPVQQSFGLTEELRENTQGNAFSQCLFDHWDLMKGNVEEDQVRELVMAIRRRKGLRQQIPLIQFYEDKL